MPAAALGSICCVKRITLCREKAAATYQGSAFGFCLYDKLPLKQAAYFDVADGRMIFAIPRNNITYVGTTDTIYNQGLYGSTLSYQRGCPIFD